MPRRLLFALAVTTFLAPSAFGQTAAPAISETMEQDSPRATPAGTTFTVPVGWTMTTTGPMVVLGPPEPDSHVAIVDLQAADADAAVAAGWAAYKKGFDRPLLISVPQAPRDGWVERKAYQ